MTVSFHGAARTVTGSKHLIQLSGGKKILLDCGLFQGMGKDTFALNNHWGFDPATIDYVIISHAHIDHTGLLPKLVKDGFVGPIYCTPATADLMRIMLPDSAHIQELDVAYANKKRLKKGEPIIEPLYTAEDAAAVMPLLKQVDYNTPTSLGDDAEFLYTNCGHIVGSASIHLKVQDEGKEVRLSFSGDVGRQEDMLLYTPEPFPQADYIIMESTYGNSLHEQMTVASEKLFQHVWYTCLDKGGKLIMPAFSIGRTQEILYMLNQLELEGRLPALDYFVDSPLSVTATRAITRHPECFNEDIQQVLLKDADIFSFTGLKLITSLEESMALNNRKEPCVIISASGMAEAGRVKHHIKHTVENAQNTILLTGYCEPQSLGGRLQAHALFVNIYGQRYEVRAEVASLRSLSAHGDYEDLCSWLDCQDPKKVKKLFLVHGEHDVQQAFQKRLAKRGWAQTATPALHEIIELVQTAPRS